MDDDDNNNNYYSIKVNIITILLLKLLLSVYPFCVKYSKNTPKYSILKGGEKAFHHHHTEIQRESCSRKRDRIYHTLTHIYVFKVLLFAFIALVVCASSSLKLIKSSLF